MNRLREEMKVIPQAAWAVALVLALVIGGVFWASFASPDGIRP
jgi:hypothetical protein